MTQPDLPCAFTIADQESIRGQRWHLRFLRVELLMLIAGASLGIPGNKVAGIGGAIVFVLAIVVRSFRITHHLDRSWQDGRAMAESVKTLAWKYAMRANPFPTQIADAEVDRIFVDRLQEMLKQVSALSLSSATIGESEQITSWMRSARAAPLTERQEIYKTMRLKDQQHWYATRAESSSRKQLRWALSILLFEACGVAFAIMLIFELKAGEVAVGGLLGVAAALGAAATAWAQARQFGASASAYTIAHQELAAIRVLLAHVVDEAEWADFINSAEAAISREHTMWQATRSSLM